MKTYIFPDEIQQLHPAGMLTVIRPGKIQQTFSSAELVQRFVDRLSIEGDCYPSFDRVYEALSGAEFYRSAIDSKYKGWTLPRNWKRDVKRVLQCEGEMWKRAFECLERMNTLGAWSFDIPIVHPVCGLAALIYERRLLNFACLDRDELTSNRAESFYRAKQSENQMMKGGRQYPDPQNPYQEGFTKTFVDAAIALGERYDGFRFDRWIPLINARTAFINAAKATSPKVLDLKTGVPIDGRGRKK